MLSCPQRWFTETSQDSAGRGARTQIRGAGALGTLIHKTIEHWINSGDWANPDNDDATAERFRRAAADAGGPLGPSRIMAASLRVQLGALRSLLYESLAAASAEEEIVDEAHRIKGKIDLLCYGAGGPMVVDVKTGRIETDSGELLGAIRTQMAVYCWLLHSRGDAWPKVVLLDLKNGIRDVPMALETVEETIRALIEARSTAVLNPEPRPAQQTCAFCSQRFTCEPHWAAVRDGRITDAVEGEVVRVESGPVGKRTVSLAVNGEASILRIAHNTTVEGVLAAGVRLRAVQVRKDPDRPRWMTGEYSIVDVSLGNTG